MTYLKDLIEKREEVFDAFTEALLDELDEITSAAGSLLGDDLEPRLAWKTVTLVDEHLLLSGTLEFTIGEKIVTEDNLEIEVTEDMQPMLNRVIHVGVPIDMAESANRQEILDYLKDIESKNADKLMVNNSLNTSHETVADMAAEFRVTGLTQEQIKSMIMFAEQSKGKVN